jgi:predicted transcriptional regulator
MSDSVTVQDFMQRDLVTFSPEMDVLEAARTLIDKRVSGAPVVDQIGNLVGVLSEKDCIEVALSAGYYEEWGGRVEEYMNRDIATVDADSSIIDVARRFVNEEYRRFPVLREGRLVGQISRRDILKALSTLWWSGKA